FLLIFFIWSFYMKIVLILITFLITNSCFSMLFQSKERKEKILAQAHIIKSNLQAREKNIAQQLELGEFQEPAKEQVLIQTSNGDLKRIAKWKIEQMRTLHL